MKSPVHLIDYSLEPGIFKDNIIVMVRLDERVDENYSGIHGIDISLLRLFFNKNVH